MTLPVCIDAKAIPWHDCQPGKFVNTAIKVLYDKDCGMPERVYYVKVRPGGAITRHSHPTTEVFFVLSGEGIVRGENQEFADVAEKIFFMRPGYEHELVNTGKEDLLIISFAVQDPAAAEEPARKTA